MEFTNLIFATLLVGVFFTGGVLYWNDVQSNYPAAANSSPYAANMTSISANLNATIGSATQEVLTTSGSDDPVGVLLGFFRGSFNALGQMMTIPSIFLDSVRIMMESMGLFMPSFLLPFIIMAVLTVVLIGLLYYWTKVR